MVQAGYGIFYDRVPLGVYAFDRFPQRVVTNYAPDGSLLGPPVTYLNLTGYAATPNSLLIHTENQPGNFAPHSGTWNVHVEHTVLLQPAGSRRIHGQPVVRPDSARTRGGSRESTR